MEDIRWKQRFKNFESALKVLKSNFENKEPEDFSELEQAGLIQQFEVVWELTWNVIKDYLENSGVNFAVISPKNTIKEAAVSFFETAGIDGDIFLEMLKTRNELAHIYDFEKFQAALVKIKQTYLTQFENLYLFLEQEAADE